MSGRDESEAAADRQGNNTARKKDETLWFRPFFGSRSQLNSGDSGPVLGVRLASTFPRGLGFLDRGLVVPAATAIDFVDARRGEVGDGFGLVIATSAESRSAPGRKLVDPGGPLIQTRIHVFSLDIYRCLNA
jgi:hypothetical protein